MKDNASTLPNPSYPYPSLVLNLYFYSLLGRRLPGHFHKSFGNRQDPFASGWRDHHWSQSQCPVCRKGPGVLWDLQGNFPFSQLLVPCSTSKLANGANYVSKLLLGMKSIPHILVPGEDIPLGPIGHLHARFQKAILRIH